jgi:hypothetical protein
MIGYIQIGDETGIDSRVKDKATLSQISNFSVTFMPHKILSQKGLKHPNKSVKFSSQF